jgi:hypothetical protein
LAAKKTCADCIATEIVGNCDTLSDDFKIQNIQIEDGFEAYRENTVKLKL